ncbi:hypothetical protein CLAFUW4_00616 [Fulvia fulva]|uniref:Serine aminopeptidase S33 domain-containing protein n=1 Tax=Passalora fulva TaxID=5499 RepID=A0A9Q8L520_PASFU|nr:uncharacterized protein CLAFUR5_00615 [Fulvia fulva]KAK4634103.1 hypothetical protein CLAFUR4_00617 [Fulvia fulva]KAK4637937.1 hypothetical protein CLAFUR0_00618 [Fulvia fulva]UJO10854.1 hypothetical protein CLAFUR5_00615 [Fulvia fulva]WPV09718.1 hypothetical protein CLAFUW4_00616 [Fulvia fulva]WPV23417.1 hypothetical protein CLAFUW7_00621 [Fulvia fulva]
MGLQSLIHQANLSSRRNLYIAVTLPAIGFLAAKLIVNLLSTASFTGVPTRASIYQAPPQRLLVEEDNVPYPADALPGGRNVDTPYGNTRVYEWGPEDGRRVLFVHGISTPCIALARMAHQLVRTGCRVMLFDLYGRGYSDAPDPNVYRQDINLFSLQILSVLASSKQNWMKGFTMVGYSLGGGIAAAFTSYYPHLVESLVLIAPGGLLRPTRISLSSKLLYSGILPDRLVNHIVKSKLQAGENRPNVPKMKSVKIKLDVADAAAEELPDENAAHAADSCSPIFEDRPTVSPATAVAWQTEVHNGFIPAFVSSIEWAPIHDGHDRWRMIAERCECRRNNAHGDSIPTGLKEGRILMILSTSDVVVSIDEIEDDATTALGSQNLLTVKLPGGHDLPITNSEGCARAMLDFWASAV